MLLTRLVTALVLASVVVATLVFLPPVYGALIFAIFLGLGAWEWTHLLGWASAPQRMAYVLALMTGASLLWHFRSSTTLFSSILAAGIAWWAVSFLFVVLAQRQRLGGHVALVANGVSGFLILLPAWSSIIWLLHNDLVMLLGLFGLIWIADAGAYFAGRRWGKRRLASNVSPGKSWEGVFGAMALALLASLIFVHKVLLSDVAQLALVGVMLASVAVSIVGDLFESMIKRNGGFKDSGNILPGHGGVLDRIDGFVAAAPIFAAGLYFWVFRL